MSRNATSAKFLAVPEVKVSLISLAHGVNDMYAGFLPVFIPHIKEVLGLNYTLAGALSVIVGICHIVFQPMIGYMCDRIRRPYLMMVGPILCGLGAVMVPNSGTYGLALFFAGLWGLGSALFHPQGTGGVGYVARQEKLPQALTLFNIAGTLGTLLSPVIAVSVTKLWGYKGLFLTLFPPLILAPLLFFSMPLLRQELPEDLGQKDGFFKTLLAVFGVLYPVWGVALVRDIVFQGVRFFLPLKISADGGSLDAIGAVLFCCTLGGTLSMIPVERLSRRVGVKRTLWHSMFLGGVILFLAAKTVGMVSIALYVLGISCIYSSMSLTVFIAQMLMPHKRSIASSLVMGLAWGVANISLLPIGSVADILGIQATLVSLALLPFLGLLFFACPIFKKVS
ncbi:MAG: MFS transporter [Fretibacterium sp.]|nr:MFS transporter [Fretibacterium sp.]